jgi:hypothetical protein
MLKEEFMYRYVKRMIVWMTLMALITVPFASAAFAESNEEQREKDLAGGMMVADALLIRPLGLVATVGGTVMFIISLPFSALGGNTGEAFDRLMADPAVFTFTRPLGDF